MRRRLVLAFVTLVVAIVALYGVPRAFVLADFVEDTERALVDQGADSSAAVVRIAVRNREPVTPDLLAPLLGDGERVEFRGSDGRGFVVPKEAQRGGDDLVARRVLDDGATITYSLSGATLDERILAALMPLLLLGLVLIPLGALAGWMLARRLARPFSELAGVARGLGTGDLGQEVGRYDVSEAEEIATALRESSRQLRDLLERERDVAVNASHELRTPITALRLALEDVSLWPDTPAEVAAELGRLVSEVDRLAEAVTTLLDARRRWAPPTRLDERHAGVPPVEA